MLHNNNTDLHKVKKNIEEAINSKLLNMGQGSGRCEMHAVGFAGLVDAHKAIEEMIKAQEVVEESTPKKKTQ